MSMNTVCHIEIQTTNFESAQAFYGAVFGWSFRSFGPEMVVIGCGDEHVGGFLITSEVQPGRSPAVWIQVADVDETLANVVAAGGTVSSAKSRTEHVGWTAEFTDPEGTILGIVQFVRD